MYYQATYFSFNLRSLYLKLSVLQMAKTLQTRLKNTQFRSKHYSVWKRKEISNTTNAVAIHQNGIFYFNTNFVATDAEHGTNGNIQALQAVQSVSPIALRISSSRSTMKTRVQDTRVSSLRYKQIPEDFTACVPKIVTRIFIYIAQFAVSIRGNIFSRFTICGIT
jgi:hypothetical protein